MRHFLDNKRFGSWVVLHYARANARGQHYWRCRCSCGTERDVMEYNLKTGRTLSCRSCSAKLVASRVHKTHDRSHTRTYRLWQSILSRCRNTNHKMYKYYGALGIEVAEEWRQDFMAFTAYIGEPPTNNHVIGLINRLGNYTPGNIAWVTQHEVLTSTLQLVRGNGMARAA